jgi:hypothetical protein
VSSVTQDLVLRTARLVLRPVLEDEPVDALARLLAVVHEDADADADAPAPTEGRVVRPRDGAGRARPRGRARARR